MNGSLRYGEASGLTPFARLEEGKGGSGGWWYLQPLAAHLHRPCVNL